MTAEREYLCQVWSPHELNNMRSKTFFDPGMAERWLRKMVGQDRILGRGVTYVVNDNDDAGPEDGRMDVEYDWNDGAVRVTVNTEGAWE